jgi:hypothetical protein
MIMINEPIRKSVELAVLLPTLLPTWPTVITRLKWAPLLRLRKSPRRAPRTFFFTVSAELRGRDDARGRSREKVMGLYACPRSEKRKKNSRKRKT